MAMQPHERNVVRFMAGHLGVGFLAAIVFEALLIFTDSFGLKALVLRDEGGALAGVLLFFGLFITFGSVAMGVAVWAMAQERDGDHA